MRKVLAAAEQGNCILDCCCCCYIVFFFLFSAPSLYPSLPRPRSFWPACDLRPATTDCEPNANMTFGNQFHMPGSFHFEGPGASTTLNANMFRPPLSPSGSSYNLAKSTGSLLSDTSMVTGSNAPAPPRLGRKRTHDESNSRYPFPSALDTDGARDSPVMAEDSARGEHRYTLAGQIETPGAQLPPGAAAMEDSMYSDIDYRRALGSKRPVAEGKTGEAGEVGLVRLLDQDSGQLVTPREAGWTTFAFQAIGGVVGKVWEFCRGGAGSFRGFQAGGGKAFEFNGQPIPTLTPAPHGAVLTTDNQEPPNSPPGAYPLHDEINYLVNYSADTHEPTSVPSYSYAPEDKIHEPTVAASNPFVAPNPFQDNKEPSPDTTPDRPAAKRRQTGHLNDADELRRNWVMVEDDEPSPLPARPTLSANAPSTASSRIPAASRSTINSRLQSPRFATPNANRRLSAPSPRFSERSSIPTRAPSRLQPSPASFAGGAASPSLNAREPASYANPRSPSRSAATPNPFATPTGSRIPQPRAAPNPFANTRTTTPPAQPRLLATSSRPSSRGSLHPSPLAQNLGTSRIATPTAPHGHRRNISNVSSSGSAHGRSSFRYEDNAAEAMQTSPRLDDEGRHLASKRFATEKRNYSRLDRLNAELQGLIRQGQEALGTTVDVDMDEDWEEDA